jgi:hypothetical protein
MPSRTLPQRHKSPSPRAKMPFNEKRSRWISWPGMSHIALLRWPTEAWRSSYRSIRRWYNHACSAYSASSPPRHETRRKTGAVSIPKEGKTDTPQIMTGNKWLLGVRETSGGP